jgi:hypothetical protein
LDFYFGIVAKAKINILPQEKMIFITLKKEKVSGSPVYPGEFYLVKL